MLVLRQETNFFDVLSDRLVFQTNASLNSLFKQNLTLPTKFLSLPSNNLVVMLSFIDITSFSSDDNGLFYIFFNKLWNTFTN